MKRLVNINRGLAVAVVAVGSTSLVTQIILLRKFLSVFSGNELVIGVLLASWLALTGAGAFAGRVAARIRRKEGAVALLLVLLAVLSPVTAFLVEALRNTAFPLGSMPGFLPMFCGSFVLLTPYCLASGFLFTLLAHTLSDRHRTNLIRHVYALEAVGSLAGGLLLTFVLIPFLPTLRGLVLLSLCNLAAALFVSVRARERAMTLGASAAAIGIGLCAFLVDPDALAKRILFDGQQVQYFKDTPYGDLVITRQGDQNNFYENGLLFFSTNDVAGDEESVHFALVQHPNPRRVLLVSGGVSGRVREIEKYGVARIDYVELNPWLIEAGKAYTQTLASDRLVVINEDARRYVRHTAARYDAVLVNLPEPATAQLNRYYTVEFLRELKEKLNPGAVLSLSLPSSADYMGIDAATLRSTLYATMKTTFSCVMIVPGARDYFLGSDAPLTTNVAAGIERRGMRTVSVNRYYIDDELLGQRSASIAGALDGGAALNRDFAPVAFQRQMLYWLDLFGAGWWWPAVAALALLAFILTRMNAVTLGMLTGGFAASSLEVLLLLAFQILCGFVYQAMAILMTSFMAGLALGSFLGVRWLRRHGMAGFAALQGLVGAYALLLPYSLRAIHAAAPADILAEALFVVLTLAIAVVMGMEFAVAAGLQRGSAATVASALYGVDLAGSAAGALLAATLLFPALGFVGAASLIGCMNIASGVVAFVRRKRYSPEMAYG